MRYFFVKNLYLYHIQKPPLSGFFIGRWVSGDGRPRLCRSWLHWSAANAL